MKNAYLVNIRSFQFRSWSISNNLYILVCAIFLNIQMSCHFIWIIVIVTINSVMDFKMQSASSKKLSVFNGFHLSSGGISSKSIATLRDKAREEERCRKEKYIGIFIRKSLRVGYFCTYFSVLSTSIRCNLWISAVCHGVARDCTPSPMLLFKSNAKAIAVAAKLLACVLKSVFYSLDDNSEPMQ